MSPLWQKVVWHSKSEWSPLCHNFWPKCYEIHWLTISYGMFSCHIFTYKRRKLYCWKAVTHYYLLEREIVTSLFKEWCILFSLWFKSRFFSDVSGGSSLFYCSKCLKIGTFQSANTEYNKNEWKCKNCDTSCSRHYLCTLRA